jgi:ankyrin repeat protein
MLTAGAKTEAREENGRTPLSLACSEGRLEVVSLLLESGADISTSDHVSPVTRLVCSTLTWPESDILNSPPSGLHE